MANEYQQVKGEVEIDGEVYRLLACRMVEALSSIPLATIEVTTPDGAAGMGPPEPAKLLGKKAQITLSRPDGTARVFVGQVAEATRFAGADGQPFARLSVAPRLYRLNKRKDCRSFQQKSAPDIIKVVLSEAGIPAAEQEHKLTASYEPRVYCVQYRESDLEFVSRLASEEGIYYAIRFEDGMDKVVFSDEPLGLGEIEGNTSIPFAHTQGFAVSDDCVMWVRRAHAVRPDKVTMRDYDFERPKFQLESSAEGKDEGAHALEVYAFPGRTVSEDALSRYAEVLLDSMQAERDVVSGEASVLSLAPGYRFSIIDHPYEPLNQEYLITRVETEMRDGFSTFGSSGQKGRNYACRFTAVPTQKTNYRPPRKERAALVAGAQTAMITGPAGAEIHTDKHVRVKAQYMWDRQGKNDEQSSVWMRTSQVPTGGSMLLPRMGWEVGVRHVEGDPDMPVVMERLYNAVTPPPYALPGGKARSALQTATTPGGGSSNELRMDDSKGKEEMMFNASKDMSVDVVNNTTESVGNNESREIGANQSIEVTNSVSTSVGSNQTISVGGNQTVHVETFMVDQCGADHQLTIGGNRDMKIGGDHRREVGGSSSLSVGANQVDLVIGSVTDSAGGNMTHNVGAVEADITAGDRSFIVGGNHVETTGAAKVIIAFGGRGVEVGGAMNQKVAGAILDKIDGDRSDQAGATFTEVAGGAHILKADNITFEADGVLSFVMGASTITLTPASISIAGVSIKIDGATAETAALVLDN